MTDELRSSLMRELLRMQKDLHYTEKAHFAAAELALRGHYILGSVSVVAASCATATVLADQLVLAGTASLISAVFSALLTFVNPKALSDRHQRAGQALGALKVQVRHIRALDISDASGDTLSGIRHRLSELAAAKSELDRQPPGTSERSFKRAKAKTGEDAFVV